MEHEIEKEIKEKAENLNHDWIILDALKKETDLNNPETVQIYHDAINKIDEIESNYTDDEILENNLLCDIW